MDLDAKAWRGVLHTNSLFSGIVIHENQTLSRASSAAFVLHGGVGEPGIPFFEPFDDSSISVLDVKSELQSAAVKYGVAWEDLGAFLKKSESTSGQTVLKSASKESLCVNYSFPRVVVYLQPHHLLLSASCKTALRKIEETKSVEDVQRFYADFGHVFSSELYLGGRLQSIQPSGSISGSSDTDKKETLKRAATVAFSTELQQPSPNQQDVLIWDTRGGDTLASSNLNVWAPTVKPSENWRVIKRQKTVGIVQIISEIEAWAHIEELFTTILSTHSTPVLKIDGVTWDKENDTLISVLKKFATQENKSTEEKSRVMELVQHMIDAGADVNSSDADGQTPLMSALISQLQEVSALLLEKGADIYATKLDGTTPLHCAAMLPDMATELVNKGAYLHAKSVKGSPLHHYAGYGCPEAAKVLIDSGARVNEIGPEGQTPLIECMHWAFDTHTQDTTIIDQMVKLLLSSGADVRATDKKGYNALKRSMWHRQNLARPRIVQLLLDAGADPNEKYEDGTTPLHLAASRALVEAARILIKAGAKLNLDGPSITPLHEAAIQGSPELIRVLVKAGANIEAVGSSFGTPLRMAVFWNQRQSIQALLNEGATVYPNDGQELSVLELARQQQKGIPSMANIVQILERYA